MKTGIAIDCSTKRFVFLNWKNPRTVVSIKNETGPTINEKTTFRFHLYKDSHPDNEIETEFLNLFEKHLNLFAIFMMDLGPTALATHRILVKYPFEFTFTKYFRLFNAQTLKNSFLKF